MSISQAFLDLLVCPEDGTALRLATPDELASVSARFASGGLKNRGGEPVKAAPTAALVRQDNKRLYPISEGIPDLLLEEGIDL